MATSSKVTQACHDGDNSFHDQLLSQIPSSSTHQSNPAHPPPYFPISEEIPGLSGSDVHILLMVPLITLSTHSNRWVGRQMIPKLWAWHAGTSQLPRNESILTPNFPLTDGVPSTCHLLPGATSQSQDPPTATSTPFWTPAPGLPAREHSGL